jgi:hypothetical protein
MVDTISTGKKWKKSSTVLVITSFVGIMCTGCITQEEPQEPGESVLEDYFRGDFAVTGEPILNSEVEILFKLNPPVDSFDTEIHIFLPEEIELVQGDTHWKGDILRDGIIEIKVIVKPVEEGQLDIHVYVKGMLDGKYEKDYTYYLVFLTSKDSGQVSRTHFYPPPIEDKSVYIPVGLVIEVPHFPNVGEEVIVTFSLIASEDVPHVKVVVVLPEELVLIDGVLEWAGDVEKEKEETFQITIKTTEEGQFEILGILTYDDEEWKYANYIFVK